MHRLSSCFTALLFAGALAAGCASSTPPVRTDSGARDGAMPPRDGGPDARTGMDAMPPGDSGPDDEDATTPPGDSGPPVDAAPCPGIQVRCGDRCVSLTSDPMNCGMCDNDCTALSGVDPARVRCIASTCSLGGACASGFGDCNATATDGCEAPLSTAEHCGNCVVACSGATPVCSRGAGGTYSCASGCSGATPDRCGSLCTDVRADPMHCGRCDNPCPDTIPNGHPTCAASVCGVACDTGYHDCGGACVSNDDPATCGTSCTPCFDPMLGTATCSAGRCGVSCDVGATACAGDCVDVMTSDAHCGGCMRPCTGACVGGVCDTGVRLSTLSGADQMAFPDQLLPMPIVVRVLDAAMMPIAGASVTFTAPSGAVISPAMATTDVMGRATATARLGRALGPYDFTATAAMALSPVTIRATAIAPAPGVEFSILNVPRVAGTMGTPGPASIAQHGAARGVAIAPDGTLYVSDYTYHVVRRIDPSGAVTIVAGRPSMTTPLGDLGPATMATLRNPSGLALDPAMQILYIADTGNNRVRAVSLATGIISTVAGGGATLPAPFGDGGSATAAYVLSPGHVRLGPDGYLYVTDTGHNRIRRVDLTTGIITLWMEGATTLCAGATIALYGCPTTESRSCDVVWDSMGRAFVSGQFCGSAFAGTTPTYGIVRRDVDGTLTRVAGVNAGLTSEGAAATATLINGAGSLAMDPAGNLYYGETATTAHRVRRIDATNGSVTTIMGSATGAAGIPMDHVAASGQPLNGPWDLALDAMRTLHVSESITNNDVRAIWQVGATTASAASIAVFSGTPQSIEIDRQVAMPFAARLTDGAGMPLAGLPITFTAIDEGGALAATSGTTTAMGVAAVFGRPGLLPGTYHFHATFEDLHGAPISGSPADFVVTATAPAAGTIFTAVNVARMTGRVPGPATLGRIGGVGGIAIAADGTMYLADRTQHVIWRVTPRGTLSILAGTGTAGFSGDGATATLGQLNAPHGLALDAPRNILYVADRTNNRIRAINLTTGVIGTIAGGGTATAAPFGDGGPATTATLSSPGNVAVDAMGFVYVSDTGRGNIRRVDPTLGLIDAWLPAGTVCTTPLAFRGCAAQPASCHVVFEADGSALISGQICGNVAPLSTAVVYGIIRRATDGTLTRIAGRPTGMTAEGAPALETLIGGAGWLARAPDGALHYADFGATSHRVRRIDPATGAVTSIAGSGTAGFGGDYVPAAGSALSTPWGIGFWMGHLVIADSGNFWIRIVW